MTGCLVPARQCFQVLCGCAPVPTNIPHWKSGGTSCVHAISTSIFVPTHPETSFEAPRNPLHPCITSLVCHLSTLSGLLAFHPNSLTEWSHPPVAATWPPASMAASDRPGILRRTLLDTRRDAWREMHGGAVCGVQGRRGLKTEDSSRGISPALGGRTREDRDSLGCGDNGCALCAPQFGDEDTPPPIKTRASMAGCAKPSILC